MNITARNSIALATGALALLGMSGMAQATDLTNFKTVFDTDFAAAGYGVVTLREVTPSLEDVYLRVVGEAPPANGA